jgi:hypothetical protein
MAVPHSWFLIACELHEKVKVLYDLKRESLLVYKLGVHEKRTDLANRSTFLLAGFALEILFITN